MFCTSCGKKNADNANFCEDCGKRLVKPIPVVPVAEVEVPVVPEPPVEIPEVPVTQETLVVPQIPEETAPEVEEPVVPEPPVAIPEMPVTQETVIVPQIPAESVTEVEDQATIVVPQIPEVPVTPEQDPLEKLYPAPKKKKNNKTGLIIGLLVGLAAAAVLLIAIIVVVVMGIASNWWRTPTPDKQQTTPSAVSPTQPVEPPAEEELSADELRQKLTQFYAGGLNIYLSSDFEQADGDNGSTFLAEDLEVDVFWGPMEKGVDSSREFAKSYEEEMVSEFDDIQRLKANGIYYTVATDGDEVTIAGFYVQDGYGWMVQIVTDDYQAKEAELINYVTLGQVAEGFVPPVSGDETVKPTDFYFSGLRLTLDESFETSSYDKYCVYENDNMMFLVQHCPLSDLAVQTSKEYAEQYLDASQEEGWSQLYMDTKDGQFYYVAMVDDEDWVNLIGIYTYNDVAWIVMAETVDGKTYSETMLNYLTSGQIFPSQIPQTLPDKTVEYEDLELTVTTDYKESYRGTDYLYLTNGEVEITVYSGQVGDVTTAHEMAEQDYRRYQGAWETMFIKELEYVVYLTAYDTADDAVNMVQGYYMAGEKWWIVSVQGVGMSRLDEMVRIATGGITPEDTFEPDDLASRDRITLTGQATAEYHGLQISYSPDWQADPSWDSGDYFSDRFAMSTVKASLASRGVSTALELAWLEAEEGYVVWEYYEVGLADDMPYVILWDESTDFYMVIGTYADSTDYWEICVTFTGAELLDQAIWYATAGVIL